MRVVALVLTAILVSGCTGPVSDADQVTEPGGFSTEPVLQQEVRFEDGISLPLDAGTYAMATPEILALSSDVDGASIEVGVFKPVLTEGERVPVLVNAGDFGAQFSVRDIPRVEDLHDSPFLRAANFIPYGYAIVTMTHRGSGGSGGCYDYFGPDTASDLAQVIEWAREQPWSNGRLGLYGFSAWGISGWMAAAHDEGVRTVVTMGATPDMYSSFFHNGSLGGRGGGATLAGILGPNNMAGVRDEGTSRDPQHIAEAVGCTETSEQLAAIADAEATAGRDRLGFYKARDLRPHVLDSYEGSVFFIHGFHDDSIVISGSVPWVQELAEDGIPVKQWIGQWRHDLPDQDIFRTADDPARRDDFGQVMLDWMNYWVRGDTSIDLGPRVEVQDTDHRWHTLEAYPPRSWDETRLFLNGDGTLSTNATERNTCTIQPQAIHADALSESPFACTFTSSPLNEALVISGLPEVALTITPEAPGGQIGAWLFTESAAGLRLITSGTIDLRVAHGGETPTPVEAGQPIETTIRMLPTQALVDEGERLVLRLWHHGHHIFPDASESGAMTLDLGHRETALSFSVRTDAEMNPYQPPIRP